MCKLNHIAVIVPDFESYKLFFIEMGMSIRKESGVKPHRQIWFYEGVQLIEDIKSHVVKLEHIAIDIDDKASAFSLINKKGYRRLDKGDNWFQLDTICFELLSQ